MVTGAELGNLLGGGGGGNLRKMNHLFFSEKINHHAQILTAIFAIKGPLQRILNLNFDQWAIKFAQS